MTATIEISSNCYRVTPAISLFSVNCVSHTGEGLVKSSRERESKEGTLLFISKKNYLKVVNIFFSFMRNYCGIQCNMCFYRNKN